MFPISFAIGPFIVNAHGVMMALGFIVGWFLVRYEARRKGLNREALEGLVPYAVVGGLIGARLNYLLFSDLGHYLDNPWEVLTIWRGGIALQGGLIGGLLVGIWYCWRYRLSFWQVADTFSPGLLLGQAIGRLGDLLVGGEYGTPTDLPWAITFNDPRSQAPLGIPLHPTQLYEMFWDLLVLGFIWRARRMSGYDGKVFLQYAFLYSLGRFVIEYFRGDRLAFMLLDREISSAMTISIVVMALSLYLRWMMRRERQRADGRG
ncbi:MAG: prolipoprotein diacylglyceryl transferase [Candidatus Binatia bacterium]